MGTTQGARLIGLQRCAIVFQLLNALFLLKQFLLIGDLLFEVDELTAQRFTLAVQLSQRVLLLTQLRKALRLLRPITLTVRLDQLQLIKLSPTLSQLLRLLS